MGEKEGEKEGEEEGWGERVRSWVRRRNEDEKGRGMEGEQRRMSYIWVE